MVTVSPFKRESILSSKKSNIFYVIKRLSYPELYLNRLTFRYISYCQLSTHRSLNYNICWMMNVALTTVMKMAGMRVTQ